MVVNEPKQRASSVLMEAAEHSTACGNGIAALDGNRAASGERPDPWRITVPMDSSAVNDDDPAFWIGSIAWDE